MKFIVSRLVMMPLRPMGNYRSIPAEIGSAFPHAPVLDPAPREHSQQPSLTVPSLQIASLEPANGSTLALGFRPASHLENQPESVLAETEIDA